MPRRERMVGLVQLVILACVAEQWRVDTSGDALQPDVQRVMQYEVSTAQVYIALRRLVERGLLVEQTAPPSHRRGRPKKYHQITLAGEDVLAIYRNIAKRLTLESSSS
jgi:DNA-binding PadR family transcriptional regulator